MARTIARLSRALSPLSWFQEPPATSVGGNRCHSSDCLTVVEVHYTHSRRVPALRRDLPYGNSNHDAARGDQKDLVIQCHHKCSDNGAPERSQSNRLHTLTAPALPPKSIELCSLSITRVRQQQQVRVIPGNVT